MSQWKGIYTIKDLETNEVIESHQITAQNYFSQTWAIATGDKRALSKREKREANQKEESYPKDSDLIEKAAYRMTDYLTGIVMKFAEKNR